jgi:electron transfer flavoprotein alpha subunit
MKENTDLVQIRPAFGGNIMAQILITDSRPQFATVRYKVMDKAEKVEHPTGKVTPCPVTDRMVKSRIEVLSAQVLEHVKSIEEEDILVVAGRGAEKAVEQLGELAGLLGGQLCFTRPMVEAGYGDTAHQIGLSGRTVKPKVILTFGVSGAIQFTACMNGSECIVAVNQDAEAPIFKIASICIKDDLYQVLPALISELKNRKDGE